MAKLELKNIKKNYGAVEILKGIDLEVQDGEFIAIVGPSGCGKSTVLKMIAGLEDISDGKIFLGEEDITYAEPGARSVGMVFQDYALYPHMSVYKNMEFGLALKKLPADEIKKRIHSASQMLGLEELLHRKPKELSGGQRQRVAMGRAIVKDCRVFLYDEPLSNLDAKLRSHMRMEIKKLHQKKKMTTLYVTHDQLEAMTLSDRIVILSGGKIEQQGRPMEVFEKPQTLFVARFIGSPEINFFEVEVQKENELTYIFEKKSKFRFTIPEHKSRFFADHKNLICAIRPSDVYLASDLNENQHAQWSTQAKVELVELLGKNAYITFSIKGIDQNFVGEVMGRSLPQMGDMVDIVFNLNHAHFFDCNLQKNIERS